MEPGIPRVRVSQRAHVLPGGDERVLHRVLGAVRVTQDERGHGIQAIDRRVHQAGEGVLIATDRSLDELSLHACPPFRRGSSGRAPTLMRQPAGGNVPSRLRADRTRAAMWTCPSSRECRPSRSFGHRTTPSAELGPAGKVRLSRGHAPTEVVLVDAWLVDQEGHVRAVSIHQARSVIAVGPDTAEQDAAAVGRVPGLEGSLGRSPSRRMTGSPVPSAAIRSSWSFGTSPVIEAATSVDDPLAVR